MELEYYDSLTFDSLDIDFWEHHDLQKKNNVQEDDIKPVFDQVFDIIPEYVGTDLRTEINRLKKALPQPNSLAELLTEESPTPDISRMPNSFKLAPKIGQQAGGRKNEATDNVQKVPSLPSISKLCNDNLLTVPAPGNDLMLQTLPLFTPGTNRKMSLALKSTFGQFEEERQKLNIPQNPLAWSEYHVQQWLAWVCQEFKVTNIRIENFRKSGRELLELGEEKFLEIAPPFTGDVLWEHLDFLVKENTNAETEVLDQVFGNDFAMLDTCNEHIQLDEGNHISNSYQLLNNMDMDADIFLTPVEQASLNNSDPPSYSEYNFTMGALLPPINQSIPQKQYRPLLRKSGSMSGGCLIENDPNDQTVPSIKSEQWDALSSSYGSPVKTEVQWSEINKPEIPGYTQNGPIQLWQFLLEMLMDKNSQHVICWTGDDWEFKVLDTEELAKRWGQRKNKPKMTYEKLSRGIRYYYDKKLIRKTSGKRYTYKFVCDMSSMLKHTPTSLFQACGVTPRYDDDTYN
ncbi:unnamed protein product [Owenia fusiformis]|uniref:Uncharacterized protein n=1 Tax=Owenia fusiformis TaxID=6347 RepID=A0A8S4N291_OWEFU|nr:unnamed protein product [Owenia fusiformis]